MKIGPNTTVFMEYDLYTKDRELLESTEDDGKIAYMHGQGMMLESLEKQMEGQSAGDEFAVELSAEEAYGLRDEAMVIVLPREQFAELGEISVGDEFQTHDNDGEPIMVTITQITDNEVTIDANHPFAGMDVVFEIKVLEVRETTEEDLKNFSGDSCGCGHDHGDGHECCGGHDNDEDHECCGGKGHKEGGSCCSR